MAIKRLCHVLKDFDTSGVIFDEVVVGGEDGGDFAAEIFSAVNLLLKDCHCFPPSVDRKIPSSLSARYIVISACVRCSRALFMTISPTGSPFGQEQNEFHVLPSSVETNISSTDTI